MWPKLLPLISVLLAVVATNAEQNDTTRVVGGYTAYNGQLPYQVSVLRWGYHCCGGSIITRNFVLTAAHCVGDWNDGWFYQHPTEEHGVRAGSTERDVGGVTVELDYIKVHEQYDWFLADLALLKLRWSLDFWEYVQPIPLATQDTPPGAEVIVSGWGLTAPGGTGPQFLKYNFLYAITREECRDRVGADSEFLLCLGHSEGNGICGGDSGGPAVWNGQLVGVTNFFFGYCGSTYPDAYANMYHHAEWIRWNTDV